MQKSISWLTGKARTKAMDAQITQLVWVNVPYRQAVRQVSELLRQAVWLDRRLDPDATIAIQIGPKPPQMTGASTGADEFRGADGLSAGADRAEVADLRVVPGPVSATQLWNLLAECRDAVVVEVDDLLFLTLRETASILSERRKSNRADVKRCASGLRASLLRKTAVRWSDYTEPSALISQWSQTESVKISNVDTIPYDLLAAGDLPPLTLLDRLTLLLIQYGQRVEFESNRLRVVSDALESSEIP